MSTSPPARRAAHLGAGAFFRAHPAWYTAHAGDAEPWTITAFPGRAPAATTLDQRRTPTDGGRPAPHRDVAGTIGPAGGAGRRGGGYTLLVRGPDRDHPETITCVAPSAPDPHAWRACFTRPELAVLTTTVTEAGYRAGPDGALDANDPLVVADLAALRAADAADRGAGAAVRSAPAKIVLGLAARRAAGQPGIAVVACDNLPANGGALARVVGELAAALDPGLAAWIAEHVGFVDTVVDRITPRTTDADRAGVGDDTEVVVTEPYTEWVLAGRFPAGRPSWEDAGARFVDDVTPYARRKLTLLNGSHLLLAYAGSLRGHDTVAAAIADPVLVGWVAQWWDEAAAHLPLPATELAAYRTDLLARYANPRIRHRLAQIAVDGSQKLPVRVLPTVRAELAAGRVPDGAARILAAWIAHLRGHGAPVDDVAAAELGSLARGDRAEAVRRVLARFDLTDARLLARVCDLIRELDG